MTIMRHHCVIWTEHAAKQLVGGSAHVLVEVGTHALVDSPAQTLVDSCNLVETGTA